MPKGGYRGGGRPKGVKDSHPRKPRKGSKACVEYDAIQKALTLSKKSKKNLVDSLVVEMVVESAKSDGKGKLPQVDNLDPLDYMRRVWNDPNESPDRRDRLAMAAMPYVHLKPGEGGKKDAKEEAATKAAGGKFKVGKSPLSLVK
jgi:hypothetical protein